MIKINPIKLLITDDHNLIIEGIISALKNETKIQVVSTANSSLDTLEKLKHNYVDVILLDINLPDENGIILCEKIKKEYPNIKIIALSNYSQKSYIQDIIQKGANGYLLKNVGKEELINAIEKVYSGKKIFSEDIQNILIQNLKENKINITKREKEVLKLVSEGLTSFQIAEKLFISVLTAETHRKNLLLKFKVNNTVQLIKQAVNQGFLEAN